MIVLQVKTDVRTRNATERDPGKCSVKKRRNKAAKKEFPNFGNVQNLEILFCCRHYTRDVNQFVGGWSLRQARRPVQDPVIQLLLSLMFVIKARFCNNGMLLFG